ncbi:MAG TPA: aldehyde dehydrogenase family protein [Bryobacteraceae bacterium]|nr:aldehyde dehydrogenase family protein [Bryobacteraceae bacterium]
MAGTITGHTVLERLGIEPENAGACGRAWMACQGASAIASVNPADGTELARVRLAAEGEYDAIIVQAREVFERWRMFPAPKRGEIVREMGDELRRAKDDLGALVTLEMGKILAEGRGEVQEMIDIADFATGLSRQLYGLTMPSERPRHRMLEQWHPLGLVGVISAFNFPVAVWSWNAFIAAVCGDCVVWKPSLKTPLTAIAVQKICDRVLERHGWRGVFSLIVGEDSVVGKRLIEDPRVPLISATGSCRMGRIVGETVARRLGRSLLELGGNNAVIVMNDANPDMVTRAVLFGAAGTAGQRCTSIRRLFLQRGISAEVIARLKHVYAQIRIGNPMDETTLMGPLIDRAAVDAMQSALKRVREQGGEIVYGGDDLGGCYVRPALVKAGAEMPILREEVFAPILYLIEFDTLEQALDWHNDVPQGLSSAIFTTNVISAETFLSPLGSDCGIANVNIGTSGAEIGGAFGGEKDTGGGRESGSDAWKSYMRRQTVTINWSDELPLAQGIEFPI